MLKMNRLALAMAGVGLVYGASTHAVESSDKKTAAVNEEHVLVTVPVHRQSNQNAIPVTVMSEDDLRNKSSSTIGETLNTLAGVNSASFGPAVGRPVIRGQQGARVTVLQNSTSVADVSSVSPDHSIVSEALLAEGIEVLRGPSTLLYGGGAIGGVVNILDKRIPQEKYSTTEGRMEIRHGSVNDESTVVAKFTTGIDNFAFYLDGVSRTTNNVEIPGLAIREDEHEDEHEDHEEEHEEEHEAHENTRGFIENTASKTEAFTVGTSYILKNGYLGVAINHVKNEYGIPPGAHAHMEHEEDEEPGEEEDHEEHNASVMIDMERTRYDIRGDWHDVLSGLEHVRWYLTHTDYEHEEIESGEEEEAGEEHGTQYKKRSTENRLELVHKDWKGWHGAVGLQSKIQDFSALGAESFIPPVKEKSFGLFLLEDFHSDFGLYQVGVRLDSDRLELEENIAEESFHNVSLALSGLWELNEALNLGVALSSAERAPTVEELFSNIGNSAETYVVHGATQAIEVGDADLASEQSRNVDISLSWTQANTEGFLTVFYNDFADYIYLQNSQTQQGEFPVYLFTQQDAKFTGAEFELKHYWQRHEAKVFADYIDGELDNGNDIPRMPPARIGFEWGYNLSRVSSRIAVLHAFEQDKPGVDEDITEAYTRVDLSLEYALNQMGDNVLFVKVKNAGDEEIRESTSFLRDVAPAAGRSFEAGLRLSF